MDYYKTKAKPAQYRKPERLEYYEPEPDQIKPYYEPESVKYYHLETNTPKYDKPEPFDYNKPDHVKSEPDLYNAPDIDPFDTLEDESIYYDELGPEPIENSIPTTTDSPRKGLWDQYDPRYIKF